ncbi:MAG TPA: ATP-binding protein, partial [Prosthecobacter sp.]|nr:ATP-binding protein [Prosthecobacter sp.]
LQRDPDRERGIAAARIAAGTVVAVGLLKISGLLYSDLVEVDCLLFSQKLPADVGDVPNRMAPNTAACLVFLGLALLFIDSRWVWVTQASAITVALSSLVALIGYSYKVRWLYGIGSLMPMALHTALLLQLLALAVLFARPKRGLMGLIFSHTPGGSMARLLFPSMVAILWGLGWLRLAGERQGMYGSDLGVALYTAALIGLFGLLIWWSVASLNRADAARLKTLAERERFFSLSLDMLCIAGTDGYFKRLNPAFGATLGYTTDELLKQPFISLVHEEDRAATENQLARLMRGESVLRFENRYRCKNGSWKWLSWKAQAFIAENLIYATAREVTAQKEAEASIRGLNAELAERARQLEEVNRELESFSYSVSHDLRAPLRHVHGYVQMLATEAGERLPEKARHYLDTISAASLEMGMLIDDLLTFSRMGRTDLHRETVDLNALVAKVRATQAVPEEREISWRIADLPAVYGDASMLRQVFANLVSNAVKYTKHSQRAQIEIGTCGQEEDRLIFFVRDNGAGFDMRYVQKLFGVFQRLHRSDEFEGTGIGLAIVRRIINRHGGRVWAEAEIDRGATFFFTLSPVSPSTRASIL